MRHYENYLNRPLAYIKTHSARCRINPSCPHTPLGQDPLPLWMPVALLVVVIPTGLTDCVYEIIVDSTPRAPTIQETWTRSGVSSRHGYSWALAISGTHDGLCLLWLDHVHFLSAVKGSNVTDGYMCQGLNGTKYYRYQQQQSLSLVLSLMDRGKQLYPIHNARM